MRVQRYLLPCLLVLAVAQIMLRWRLSTEFDRKMREMPSFSGFVKDSVQQRCAINFYGLPRAFHLVLPSIIKHVIEPNQAYHCDYFVHFYNQTTEAAGRSGNGGIIKADDILRLRRAVQQAQQRSSPTLSRQAAPQVILFASDTNASFYQSHDDIVQDVLTARDETNTEPLYHPWLERDYDPTPLDGKNTMLNIIKLWHSVDRSWNLMEEYGLLRQVNYTRVAMLRSDVVFLTPFDLWDTGVPLSIDTNNSHVVIPGFARYPVNDRAIYGSAVGVQIWATSRFKGLAQHVEEFRGSGYVMHHERFVDAVLFSAIRQKGIQVVEHPSFCFCRARADNRVWFTDCTRGNALPSLKKAFPDTSALLSAVELAVNKTCNDVGKGDVSGAVSVLCE